MSLLDRERGTVEAPPGPPPTTQGQGPFRTWLWIAIIAVLALVGAGLITYGQLNGDPGPKPTPPPATQPTGGTSTGPTAPTTQPLTPEQIAVQGATAGYKRYSEVTDAMYRSGGKDTSRLSSVATGTALKIALSGAKTYRNRGLRSVGAAITVWTKPTSIGSQNLQGMVTAVSLSVCTDPGTADTLDRNGKPLPVVGNPKDRLLEDIDLVHVGGVWKVTEHFNKIVKTC